jgi:hypothetical protein
MSIKSELRLIQDIKVQVNNPNFLQNESNWNGTGSTSWTQSSFNNTVRKVSGNTTPLSQNLNIDEGIVSTTFNQISKAYRINYSIFNNNNSAEFKVVLGNASGTTRTTGGAYEDIFYVYPFSGTTTISQPDCTLTFKSGDTINIEWDFPDIYPIKIDLYSGTTLKQNIVSSTTGTGYTWVVHSGISSGYYTIKTTGLGEWSNYTGQTCIFRIINYTQLIFTSPTGGTFYFFEGLNIVWNSPIDLHLYLYSGATMVYDIVNSTDLVTSYDANIPTLTAGTYYIKGVSNDVPENSAITNSFSLIPNPYTIPTGYTMYYPFTNGYSTEGFYTTTGVSYEFTEDYTGNSRFYCIDGLWGIGATDTLSAQTIRYIRGPHGNLSGATYMNLHTDQYKGNETTNWDLTQTMGYAFWIKAHSVYDSLGCHWGVFLSSKYTPPNPNGDFEYLLEAIYQSGTSLALDIVNSAGTNEYYRFTGITFLNTWNHIVYTRSMTTQYLYVNGSLIFSSGYTWVPFNNWDLYPKGTITIAALNLMPGPAYRNQEFNADMAHLVAYNRQLSQTDVTNLYYKT